MKTVTRLMCLLLCLCLAGGNGLAEQTPDPEREAGLREHADALLRLIREGDEAAALLMMDETMSAAMTGQIGAMWPQLTALGGEFEGTGEAQALSQDGFDIVLLELRFKNLTLIQRTVFDGNGKVAGLFFAPGSLTPPAPETNDENNRTQETALTVDAGEGYPLDALLTLPEGEVKAGIVLVQGSGPSDKDESIGANAPFRDLARGLAGHGIATLRYDKRSYAHGKKMTEEAGYPRLTVDEETVDDAGAALRLLRERPELAGRPVWLLGHSLGAMLASYIGSKAGAPEGYILLAGSPRKLWEVSREQNLAIAREYEAAGDMFNAKAVRDIVAAEEKKAAAMDSLADDDTVFGLPVPYQRHLQGIDAAALHMQDQKPVLVLQGERDKQVSMDDFLLWQEKLKGHPAAEFISYPLLNHLFGDYQGEPVTLMNVAAEYAARTPVDEQVIEDIAGFVLR